MTAQMGPPAAAKRSAEEMLAYWASRREGGRLPARRQIHPGDFKRHLPTISLIEVRRDPERDYRQRLAGTGLYGMYGGEITGKTLSAVYPDAVAAYWRAELDKVVDDRRPAVGTHNLAWRGAAHITFMWLRMPLSSNGTDVDMILGYDVPLAGTNREFSGIRAA